MKLCVQMFRIFSTVPKAFHKHLASVIPSILAKYPLKYIRLACVDEVLNEHSPRMVMNVFLVIILTNYLQQKYFVNTRTIVTMVT